MNLQYLFLQSAVQIIHGMKVLKETLGQQSHKRNHRQENNKIVPNDKHGYGYL
jgi:hypothetical protein